MNMMISGKKKNCIPVLRRMAAVLLSAGILLGMCFLAAAASWIAPEFSLHAGAAIVMDADTGTVLWGDNIHENCYPASITKIMTALLVLENCSQDDIVTITADSVYGLESGAITAGLSVDDEVTVRDLLYATLFRSAADSSNALAIYMSGSVSAFAQAMTDRARELGCRNTVFRNPSGLTDPEHVTTAYDMALIGQACFNNPDFMEIESSDNYKMGPTAKYPGGLTVTFGHKMKKAGTQYSDPRVKAGKTGFITASGNTLITMAEEDGRRLVAVVLKDKNPEHYLDTKQLLDFGFEGFVNAVIEDPLGRFACEERLRTDRVIEGNDHHLAAEGPATVTVPRGYDEDAIQCAYDYNVGAGAPEHAVARLRFSYGEVENGSVYILDNRESAIELGTFAEEEKSASEVREVPVKAVLIGLGIMLAIFLIALTALLRHGKVQEERDRAARFQERRRRRLEELHMSEEEFRDMVAHRHGNGRPMSGAEEDRDEQPADILPGEDTEPFQESHEE